MNQLHIFPKIIQQEIGEMEGIQITYIEFKQSFQLY